MTINHLNLVVSDVGHAATFFQTNFDFAREPGPDAIAILNNAEGFTLVLMSQKDRPQYPRNFHFGFFVDTPEQVDSTHARLTANGVPLENAPALIRDTYGFYFHFDQILLEVGHRTAAAR